MLELRFEPMNKDNGGGCLIDGQESFSQYRIPSDSEGNSMITGDGRWTGKSFTCSECEVYSLDFGGKPGPVMRGDSATRPPTPVNVNYFQSNQASR